MNVPFPPMLATPAEPFDSGEYLFEIKWDGVRALAAVDDHGGYQLWGRELADYRDRYPELDWLRRFPPGTVVDGEIVVLRHDRCDFNALLQRHQLSDPLKIRLASRQAPVHYILFDALFHNGRALFAEPFYRRRGVLVDLYQHLDEPNVKFSEGVNVTGQDFFERMVARGHEGIMAKHHASHYLPGRRSASWRKIKPEQVIPCVIIGYTPRGADFDSVFVATVQDGKLCYVAELTCGFTNAARAELKTRLAGRVRRRPAVPCPHRGTWVEPELYCRVRFQHWTPAGRLRGASFAGLIEDSSPFGVDPQRN
ncbi:MAG: hypothetical protein AB7K24_16965 [Gemmataceae bacterium]